MLRAVDVGTELHSLFAHFSDIFKREYLETAAVGEYGAFPAVELVQAPCFFKDVEPRSQVQVVGVAKYYLCFHIAHQVGYLHCLY